ncbi:MAG: UPF0280 family protein [Thermodesulfobacteriota bacterium]|nr:UPF0280 family protein [Thermodesulfobacteriota bacterium]
MFLDPDRGYRRSLCPAKGEVAFQVVVEETDLWIVAEKDLSGPISEFVHELRGPLKSYILAHPEFLKSLKPVGVSERAPKLVQAMAEAARACDVGPMAAVAGAIAQAVAKKFAGISPNILVENGGDLYLCSQKERVVGILFDPKAQAGLGLKLERDAFPLSLCASSGKIGHSLSLGQADLVVAGAKDGSLADAAATALGNMLRSASDLAPVLKQAKALERTGLNCVLAQCQGKIAAWGRIELTAVG